VLAVIGEPYVTTRAGEGMGLGVVAGPCWNTPGRQIVANRLPYGARIAIEWSRSALEVSTAARDAQ
jgi:nitrogen fixation/metabolism regulation signal transduction histidine kinase